MKKLLLILVAVLVAGFISGCSRVVMKPISSEGVSTYYVEGVEVAQAQREFSSLRVICATEGNELYVVIRCSNTSSEQFDLFPSDVSVVGVTDGHEEKLTVYDPEEYLKKKRTAQAIGLFAQGMSNAYESANAGHSSSYSTYDGTIYDGGTGYSKVYGSSSTSTYGPAAKAAVDAQNQLELQQSAKQMQENYSSYDSSLLKANTLFPGKEISGVVIAKYSKADKFLVKIRAGQDEYLFEFVLPDADNTGSSAGK